MCVLRSCDLFIILLEYMEKHTSDIRTFFKSVNLAITSIAMLQTGCFAVEMYKTVKFSRAFAHLNHNDDFNWQ